MASSTPPPGPPQAPPPAPAPPSPIEVLASRRTGGADAIKGFVYQTRYAALRLLKELLPDEVEEAVEEPIAESVSEVPVPEVVESEGAEDVSAESASSETSAPAPKPPTPEIHTSILLEGLEDVDVIQITRLEGVETGRTRECVQAKCSLNTWNAHSFSETWVLHNFVEAYLLDPTLTFRIVHSAPLPQDGALAALVQSIRTGQPLTGLDFHYWKNHINDYRQGKGRRLDWTNFSMNDFLARITFEQIDEDDLISQLRQQITTKFELKADYDQPYVNALLWATLVGSRDRQKITVNDIRTLVDAVTQDIIKGHSNEVVRKSWLTPVSFDEKLPDGEEEAYFEGKAARPFHISAGLPARRKHWEREFHELFDQNGVTVIRASSGQGKSTLAWQVVKDLSEKGWTPYELRWCGDEKEVGPYADFLKTRIRLGELPLVVIDGLQSHLSAWRKLAESTRNLPVRYVVTSREDDWKRFGGDPSGVRLRLLSLEMSLEEAEAIYDTLGEKGKLHEEAPVWQMAWERAEGLLIEYVALVTGGQMLKERVEYQVTALGKEPDAKACFQILRLVSLADVLGLRLSEESLLEHVEQNVGFEGPSDEVLRSLDDEFLKVGDEDYGVRGVHPVRSGHLSDRLNRSYRLRESLIGLIGLIDSGDLFEFCSQAPLLLQKEDDQAAFLKALAENIAERPYAEMVTAIEGTFCADAHRHWEQNREFYDRLTSDRAWKVSLTEEILQHLIYPSKMEPVSETIEKLDTRGALDFIRQLLPRLQGALVGRTPPIDDPKSLAVLEYWFEKFHCGSPILPDLDPSSIWELVETHGLVEVGGLFHVLNIVDRGKYNAVMAIHQADLEKRICEATDILRMSIEQDYIWFTCFDGSSSLARLMISQFFPHFSYRGWRIDTPPNFDSGEEIRGSPSDFTLDSDFFYSIHDLWRHALLDHYRYSSNFEWQNQWFHLRQRLVNAMDALRSLFERKLCGDEPLPSEIESLDGILSQFWKDLGSIKTLSSKRSHLREERQPSFFVYFRYFVSKVYRVFKLLSVETFGPLGYPISSWRLTNLHQNYQECLGTSFAYFDPSDLEAREIESNDRLKEAVRYFFMGIRVDPSTSNVLEEAKRVLAKQDRRRLDHIGRGLDSIASQLGVHVVLLDEIVRPIGFERGAAVLTVRVDSDDDLRSFLLSLALLTYVGRDELGVDDFYIYPMGDDFKPRVYSASWNLLVSYRQRLERSPLSIDPQQWSPRPLNKIPGSVKGALSRLDPNIIWKESKFEGDFKNPESTFNRELFEYFWKLRIVRDYLKRDPQSKLLPKLEVKFRRRASGILTSSRDEPKLAPHLDALDAMLESREPASVEALKAIFYPDSKYFPAGD